MSKIFTIIKTEIDKSQVEDYLQIKDKISDILLKYKFEFNTEEVRDKMKHNLSQILKQQVLDETTIEMIDYNSYYFVVKIGDKKYPLLQYLSLLERFQKIKKILDKK